MKEANIFTSWMISREMYTGKNLKNPTFTHSVRIFAICTMLTVSPISLTFLFLHISTCAATRGGCATYPAELGSLCNHCIRCKSYMTCDTGKTNVCICARGFVQEKKNCLAAPGEFCDPESTVAPPCSTHSTCNLGTCQCDSGYKQFYDAAIHRYKCLPLNGTPCDQVQDICPASTGLYCKNRVCACQDGYQWSGAIVKCLSKVNRECDSSSTTKPCIANAVCSDGYCKCSPGYTRTKDDTCQRKLGSFCNHWETVSTEKCNADEFLECGASKVCQCLAGKAVPGLESTDKTCKFLPGQRCDASDSDVQFKKTCVENSECVKGKSGDYTCERKSGKNCQLSNDAKPVWIIITLLFGVFAMGNNI